MSPTDALHELIRFCEPLLLVYFVAISFNYALLFVLGRFEVWRYVQRRLLRNYTAIGESRLSLAVSVLMPAHNEGPVIVDAVRSMLDLNYQSYEVVVINDGSTDDTLERLQHEFRLVRAERVPSARLAAEPLRGVYVSPDEPRLVVVDKRNGGKADSLNAGVCYARYPLFCAVDADTLLDRDALPRLVWQFQSEPDTVAVGGIVRIVNGCRVGRAVVEDVRLPRRQQLVAIQVVEYLRAFLTGRTGWSRLGMLLIISGAFGLFRRDAVIAAGGYRTDTVGEDAELVVRLHRHCREQRRPYKLSFIADPVAWTEAPADLRTLARQRNRWQRGLLETLWTHRAMLLRPRYGKIGMLALPYFVVFEALGPVIEVAGYLMLVTAAVCGWLSLPYAAVLLAVAVASGLALSLGTLYIEEKAFNRYRRPSDLARLALAAVAENFGYRQWQAAVRVGAIWSLARGAGWGEMQRAGFAPPSTPTHNPAATPPPPPLPATEPRPELVP